MVVLAHCCDPFVAQFNSNYDMFLTGVFCGSLMRPCVPLFVMMTAVLLLPIKNGTTINAFYKKRIGRIIAPLVFWSLALPILIFAYVNYINPATTNPYISVDSYIPVSLVNRLYTFIFNFNFDTTPLWYLYMLVGLYLMMPIINTWLVQTTKKELKTLLYIWVGTLFIPYIKMLAPVLGYQGNYGNMELFGGCDWNIYGTFYYVSGFAGYLILAYYLKTYPLNWSWKKLAAICIPMFIIGFLITSVGYIITNEYFPGNYAYLEILWYFTGINVFMMTFPIFAAIQKLNVSGSPSLTRIASLTFGIYLCHFVFIFLAYDIYNISGIPYVVRILLSAITVFVISGTITYIMNKWSLTQRFIK